MILKKIADLKIPAHLAAFTTALQKLRKLFLLVNHDLLPGNYQQVIDEFTSAWCVLSEKYNVSITPKVRIIMDHLADYFDLTNMREVVKNKFTFIGSLKHKIRAVGCH